jgi:hypothetical protein
MSLVAPLSASVTTPAATWAVVPMGDLHDPVNTFWQVFVQPAGQADWSLVTPPGVADNGGLVLAPAGGDSAAVGFEPSQALSFSPLAQTTDLGRHWTSSGLVPGLAPVPDALAGTGVGTAVALERRSDGTVVTSSRGFGDWHVLATRAGLAGASGTRTCSVGSLTAVTENATGGVLVGTTCRHAGTVGIFTERNGTWTSVGPHLGPRLATAPVRVLRLTTGSTGTTTLLGVGRGAQTGVAAAWSPSGGAPWTVSAPLVLGSSARIVSTGVGPAGQLVVLTERSTGVLTLSVTTGVGSGWRTLPTPPPGTQTVAVDQGGGFDALSVDHSTLTDWVLGPSSTAWQKARTSSVPIQYGSSS